MALKNQLFRSLFVLFLNESLVRVLLQKLPKMLHFSYGSDGWSSNLRAICWKSPRIQENLIKRFKVYSHFYPVIEKIFLETTCIALSAFCLKAGRNNPTRLISVDLITTLEWVIQFQSTSRSSIDSVFNLNIICVSVKITVEERVSINIYTVRILFLCASLHADISSRPLMFLLPSIALPGHVCPSSAEAVVANRKCHFNGKSLPAVYKCFPKRIAA